LARRKRGWNEASRLTLIDLQRLIDEKHTQAAKLEKRRDAVVAELADIDAELGSVGAGRADRRRGKRGPGRPPKAGRRRGPGRPPKAKRGRPAGKRRGRKPGPKGQSPLHNAIRVALNGAAEPMGPTDIAAKVRAGGYKTKSKTFNVIVAQRLTEMKDVKKPARGLYAIA
jgi:hypothetical protein